MLDIVSEVKRISTEKEFPFNAIIELSTKCNWKCKHCYIPKHDNVGMSKRMIFNVLKQLRDLGTFNLTFTGGEIFYRKDTIEIIEMARSMFFDVTLFSNISLLKESDIKALSEMGISLISCTIFSMQDYIHDFITGVKGSLKKALDNIMLMKKYKLPLEIKVILTKYNYKEYIDVKKFCEENNILFKVDFNIFSKSNGDEEPQDLRMTDEQFREVLLDIDEIIGFKPLHHCKDEDACIDLKNSISIDASGNVYPCNRLFEKIGNVYEEDIKDIFLNSKRKSIKEIKWSDLDECLGCSYKEYCFRCPAIALLEDGSLVAKSSLSCKVAKLRHEIYNTRI